MPAPLPVTPNGAGASAGGALLGAVQPARENTASGAEPGAGEEGFTGALTAGGEKGCLVPWPGPRGGRELRPEPSNAAWNGLALWRR